MEPLTRPKLIAYLSSLRVKARGARVEVRTRRYPPHVMYRRTKSDTKTCLTYGRPVRRIEVFAHTPDYAHFQIATIILWCKRGSMPAREKYAMAVMRRDDDKYSFYCADGKKIPKFWTPSFDRELEAARSHFEATRKGRKLLRAEYPRLKKLAVESYATGEKVQLKFWIPSGKVSSALDAIQKLKEAK